ncbi:alanine dehydrogenase [Gorillibacterium sp. sgz500922]|uniref:alanine dehydrogenase n=1 Tax=Gorillibacterium sp. sgz500922 TaxID=3446694 RepID=UPI003F67672E
MQIGVPKEIKNNENRVGLTPAAAAAYREAGHEVLVERGAGTGAGFADEEYARAGASIVATAEEAWEAEMVVKVKEPLPEEFGRFRSGQILYTYLHLAPEKQLTEALVQSGVTAIAYETIQREDGSLPLLIPMSEVAGRMAVQIGAHFLEKAHGGKGVLLGGIPGVAPGRVVIVGGGVVGTQAAAMAVGLGAEVTVLDKSLDRLRQLDDLFRGRIRTIASGRTVLEEAVRTADLLIGAVLVPGARAPRIVRKDAVAAMEPGSVIVDVAIDQGGSIETVDRITTHDQPTYVKHGVLHYSVANMPGAVPRTSTIALTNATLEYGLQIAGKGFKQAARENAAIARGINVAAGQVAHPAVAAAHGYSHTEVAGLLQ